MATDTGQRLEQLTLVYSVLLLWDELLRGNMSVSWIFQIATVCGKVWASQNLVPVPVDYCENQLNV